MKHIDTGQYVENTNITDMKRLTVNHDQLNDINIGKGYAFWINAGDTIAIGEPRLFRFTLNNPVDENTLLPDVFSVNYIPASGVYAEEFLIGVSSIDFSSINDIILYIRQIDTSRPRRYLLEGFHLKEKSLRLISRPTGIENCQHTLVST